MFEAYTEATRKVFFIARYEASKSKTLRRASLSRLFAVRTGAVRKRVEGGHEADSTADISVDLPLSRHCKRVVAYAAAEAESLHHKHITSEHLLLGIVRENTSLTARVMLDIGVTILQLETEATRANIRVADSAAEMEGLPNLVAEARAGATRPPARIGSDDPDSLPAH